MATNSPPPTISATEVIFKKRRALVAELTKKHQEIERQKNFLEQESLAKIVAELNDQPVKDFQRSQKTSHIKQYIDDPKENELSPEEEQDLNELKSAVESALKTSKDPDEYTNNLHDQIAKNHHFNLPDKNQFQQDLVPKIDPVEFDKHQKSVQNFRQQLSAVDPKEVIKDILVEQGHNDNDASSFSAKITEQVFDPLTPNFSPFTPQKLETIVGTQISPLATNEVLVFIDVYREYYQTTSYSTSTSTTYSQTPSSSYSTPTFTSTPYSSPSSPSSTTSTPPPTGGFSNSTSSPSSSSPSSLGGLGKSLAKKGLSQALKGGAPLGKAAIQAATTASKAALTGIGAGLTAALPYIAAGVAFTVVLAIIIAIFGPEISKWFTVDPADIAIMQSNAISDPTPSNYGNFLCSNSSVPKPTTVSPVFSSDGKYAFPVVGYAGGMSPCRHWDDTYAADIFSGQETATDPPLNLPTVAYTSGTISYVSFNDKLGGIYVILHGDDGNYYYYAHHCANYVSAGQRVSAGEVIGITNQTGMNAKVTPEHLHFAIYDPSLPRAPLQAPNGYFVGGGNICPFTDFRERFNISVCAPNLECQPK